MTDDAVARTEGLGVAGTVSGALREREWTPFVHQRFARQARTRPEKIAVWYGARQLSYGELEARSNRLAHFLRKQGVGPEVLVGVCTDRTPERVIAIVAILKAGGAFVSFDPGYPLERLEFLVSDARTPVLLTERSCRDRLPRTSARIVCLDLDLEDLEGDESAPPRVDLDPENLAYVVYTSGSTGKPKGVAVPHRGLLNLASWQNERYQMSPADRGGLVASPAFDASLFELWPFLMAGAGLAIPDEETRLSASRTLRWWAELGITVAFLPTPLAEVLLEEEVPPGLDLRVRVLTIGGDRLRKAPPPGTRFELSNVYGPAEASVATTEGVVPPQERGAVSPPSISIGRPIDNMRVHLLDPDLDPVASGAIGELFVSGDGLARGYQGRPDLTAERFLPNPFGGLRGEAGARMYRTGDLASLRPAGDLDFLGRIDHQVKILGIRVELGEIESVLASLPGVSDAVVLAGEGKGGSTRLVAFVVPLEGELGSLPESELRAGLAATLPAYMIPSAFVRVASFPLTPNGKVDRRVLADLEVSAEAGASALAPRTEMEEALAPVFAEMLGVERVGVEEDFFRLGGHSLLAIRLLSRLRTLLGVELEIGELFAAPTVAALARTVAAATGARRFDLPLVAVPRGGELPLSFAQVRLWFFDRVEPGSPLYNLPFAYRLEGELRPAALQAALAALVERHEALRTRFMDGAEGAEGPIQVVDPAHRTFALPFLDLSALPAFYREVEEGRLGAEVARLPFDLARGPLFRALLVRRGEAKHELLLTLHHIVSDGWTMGVLQRELGALYGAALAPEPVSPLPPLPLQYGDYALWQRRWLAGPELERQLAYWRERLSGLPPLLELPTDRPRPPVQAYRGAVEPLALGSGTTERLKEAARRRSEPLFMTLLAGVQAFLQRYTQQDDFAVGTPFAGRGREELEGQAGFFVNMLALRAEMAGDPDFATLTDRARATALGAFAHGDLPFDRIVEELAPERSAGSSPLFQVAFALQTAAMAPPRLAGLTVSARPLPTGTAKFDLTLFLTDTDEGLAGELEYDRALFDGTTIRRWARHLANLFAAVVAGPGAGALRLSELPLLGAEERSEVLHSWNDTSTSYPREASIHGRFAAQVRLAPGALAVMAPEGRLSYEELDARAVLLACRLRAAGVRPDDAVGLAAERSLEMVVGMLAILKAGGGYLPLDPAHPRERLAFQLEDTGARVVLAQERLLTLLPATDAETVLLDGAAAAGPRHEPSLPAQAENEGNEGGDRLAYVIYTSGSTGRPKGVAIPHRGVLRLVVDTDYVRLGPGDRVIQGANAAFDAATYEIWGPLLNGAAVIVLPQEVMIDPAGLEEAIRSYEVSSLFLTTALFNQVAREAPGAFAPLREILFGGEAVDASAVRAVLGGRPPGRLLHFYGPTENTTYSTWHEVTEVSREATTVPIGRPIANSRSYVLDPHGGLTPVGAAGQLYVGGDGLARGYVGRPDLTAERFVPDPCSGRAGERLYATGDLVRQGSDGAVEFVGRADGQVKIRGFRIELGEIEAALAGHPEVGEAAVVAREEAAGKRLVAYVVPATEGATPDFEALLAHLRSRLPDYMIPSAFVPLAALPLTPNGKVDRRALSRLVVEAEEGDHVAPRSATEEALASLFLEVLRIERIERIGVRDDFFRLGGHSLLATQLATRIHRRFGVEVGLRAIFERPTIEALAELVEREGGTDRGAQPEGEGSQPFSIASGAASPRAGDETYPLSFAQSRLWFLDRLERGSPLYNVPFALHLAGELAIPALAAAVRGLVERHEALRTLFLEVEGEPLQRIEPVETGAAPEAARLPLIDLSALPAAAREREASFLTHAEARRPFDLERGPVARFALLRMEGRAHLFFLTFHHIVADGWSIGIALRELAELYAAHAERSERRRPLLAPLPVRYTDFAVWQRRWLSGERIAREADFWRETLGTAPAVLDLPTDRPRPAVQRFRGGAVDWRLPPALAGALTERALGLGATPYLLLLAAFQALLGRRTSQGEVSLGSPAAGRTLPEIEGVIGFFVNTLVLRTPLADDPTYRELVARVREVSLRAQAHQDLPFEKLVEALDPERSLSYSPLFQVMLTLNNDALVLALPGVRATPAQVHSGTAKFDLLLGIIDFGTGLEGSLEYDSDLFDRTTAIRLLAELETLLAAGLAEPGLRLSELPLLAPAGRHQVAAEWNDTGVSPGLSLPLTTCQERFAAQARAAPARAAATFGGAELSYGELEARSNRLAHLLLRLGVDIGAGVPVGLCLERSLDLPVAVLGVLKAGGVLLPLDPSYPAERLRFMLADSGAPVLLTSGELGALWSGYKGTVFRLDGGEGGLGDDLASLPEGAVEPRVGAADLCYLIYTSGSTGQPKGVALPHATLSNLVDDHLARSTGAEARTLQFTPLSFDVGLQEIFSTWSAGGTLVLISDEERRDPEALLRVLDEERVTRLFLPFVALHHLAEAALAAAGAGRARPLPYLREVITAGEQLQSSEALLGWFGTLPGCTLDNHYGPSETHVVTAFRLPAEVDAWPALPPIGRPIRNTRAFLLDGRFQPVPIGVAGEVYLGGIQTARGYLGRPALTAEKFLPDPFSGAPGERLYRTGDLARHLADGSIEFLGRIDLQVKVRGYRIELGEIESALAEHPAVREAVVTAPEIDRLRRLVAYVVPAGEGGQAAILRAHLAARLPDYMVPSFFVFVDDLPLGATGKVDRRSLPLPAAQALSAEETYVAPRTPEEERVAAVWAEVLGLDRVGVHDSFWDLGGHSLLATRILSRLNAALGRDLPLRLLFRAPTIAGFLAAVRDLEAASGEPGGSAAAPEPKLSPLPRPEGRAPASFAQSRLWFLDRMDPGTPVYSLPVGYRFRAKLEPPALAMALAEIVRRHESLRTRFAPGEEGPVQVIDPPAPPPFVLVDLAGLPPEIRPAEERRLAAAEALRPFDLEAGPLFRAQLLRLDGEDWVLLLGMHHIVSDGWSLGVLARELEALYAAALDQGAPSLPEPRLQYADYAGWQREWLQGGRLEAQLAYWRAQLASPPEPLELPVDRPFPAVRSNRGELEKVSFGSDLSPGMAALSRATGASPFMVQLAVFAALLHRYTGATDLLIGTPTAGRSRVELERLIGFFINSVVLRADAAGDPSILSLIERVRETAVAAYAQADLPFERVVEAVAPQRNLGRPPLFQVMFVLQDGLGMTPPRLAGAEGEPLDLRIEAAKFDLSVALSQEAGGIEGVIEFNLDVFDPTTIRRWAGHWRTLAAGAVARPEARLSELPLLAPAELAELVVEWNATGAAYPSERSIDELFREQAERTPEALALVEGETKLTYSQVARRASTLARRLRAAGVGVEGLVALAVERSAAMVIGMLAILEAGGAYAPIDPSYPEDRLAYLFADSRASLLLTRAELQPALAGAAGSLPLRLLDDVDDVEGAEGEDEERGAGNRPWRCEEALGGDRLAYLIYTSGSTGHPKGVAVPHRGVVRLVRGTDYVRLGPETVLAQLANASFDATTFEVWGALLNGGAVAIVSQEVALSPPKLAAELRRHKVTTLFLTTALFNQTAREAPEAFATLDDLLTGGEAADPRWFAEAFRAGAPRRLLHVYGPTENTTFSTWHEVGERATRSPTLPIGRSIANSQVYVLDPHLEPVPAGVRGALYVGGDGLARGYWHRPELTAERFVPSPFAGEGGTPAGARLYATGDLVRWLPDGSIDFIGRIDQQVKIRGFRIEPGEIEAALLALPGVAQAAVLALPDAGGGKRLAAYVVGGGGGEPPLEPVSLRAHLRSELPEYMVPSALVLLDSLPLTPNGKVDRRALATLEAAPQSGREYAPPETAIETLLAGIWSEALGVERIGRDDDFWDLGGHSLLATKVSARIAAAFDVEIPLRTLFQAPTLAELAQVVGEALLTDDPPEGGRDEVQPKVSL